MFSVHEPSAMNDTFAHAFNSREIENLMSLYEPGSVLCADPAGAIDAGLDAIRARLTELLRAPGAMTSRNNFCIALGDLALLRADWSLRDGDQVVAAGSSAEIVRRQADGRWLYVIDHAMGASLPAPA